VLSIHTTWARVGIDIQPARMKIHSPAPTADIKTTGGRLEIESQQPRVYIDQYQCFKELGYKSYKDLAKETAQASYRAVIEYIGKIARQGDRLAAIELGGNPIAEIAADTEGFTSSGRKGRPISFPTIHYNISGGVHLDYQKGSFEYNIHTPPVTYDVTPYSVDCYLEQKPGIRIEYRGTNIDRRI
jgi:hypothetical protein